ncbi:MAG TPA: plasmid pRiA4b ORF-3 family protein [Herpetosiphonaceae bacterium]
MDDRWDALLLTLTPPELAQLQQTAAARHALLGRLGITPPTVAAPAATIRFREERTRCSSAGCHCHFPDGQLHGGYWYAYRSPPLTPRKQYLGIDRPAALTAAQIAAGRGETSAAAVAWYDLLAMHFETALANGDWLLALEVAEALPDPAFWRDQIPPEEVDYAEELRDRLALRESAPWSEDLSPPPRPAAPPVQVYQFHIALADIMPQIWRRVLIRSDATLADLHQVIQIAFGWEGYHLHQFHCGYATYGQGGMAEHGTTVPLHELELGIGGGLIYEYDFGDRWIHDIELEDVLLVSPRKTYPQCTGGAQAGPPEDCGGAWAYMEKLRRSAQAKAAAARRRLRTGKAPATKKKAAPAVDRRRINRQLAAFGAGREDWWTL